MTELTCKSCGKPFDKHLGIQGTFKQLQELMTELTCKSCGVPFDKHLGIQGTCKQLQELIAGLKIIRTWAAVPSTTMLRDFEQIRDYCDELLEKGGK